MSYAYLPEEFISAMHTLSLSAIAVGVSVASFMDGKATGCYPSILAIKKRAGLKTDKTVRKVLKELKGSGLLSIQERPGQSSLIRWAEPPARDDGGTQRTPLVSDHPGTLSTTPSVEHPSTPSVSRPEPLVPNHPRRIKKKDTKKDNSNVPPFAHSSTAAPPSELVGLELYETDTKLCEAWPSLFKSLERAYPNLDILAEVAKAHAWEVANPMRRKTNRARFFTSWLARASKNPQPPNSRPDPAELEFEKASLDYGNSGIEDRLAAEARESGGGVK